MKLRVVLLVTAAWLSVFAQSETMRVGSIDFFGTKGVKVAAVRAAMPVQPGDTISMSDPEPVKHAIDAAVLRIAGKPPTDVSATCCGADGGLLIYIGLPGQNSHSLAHLPVPSGQTCLPQAAEELYTKTMDALQTAVRNGDAAEDHSKGYAIAHNAELRERQVAMRAYAAQHAKLLESALRECHVAENRQAAAHLLGYANRSKAQIEALVQASRDSDGTVRNNAVRALWVLAESGKKAASMIAAQPFVAMLNSGTWEDRNKAGLLLTALAQSRDPKLVSELRGEALDSLVEMARWHNLGHAGPYRELLGIIAGFDDHKIHQLIATGKTEELIESAEKRAAAGPRR